MAVWVAEPVEAHQALKRPIGSTGSPTIEAVPEPVEGTGQ